jgi:hypothetical protein
MDRNRTARRPAGHNSNIGVYRRGEISWRDRAAIERTLPPEIDRQKLWAELNPIIVETRTPKEIVKELESAIHTFENSIRTLTELNDSETAQSVGRHVTKLRKALRYYTQPAKRRQAGPRLRKFRILRAWLNAGGQPTIVTPDDPDRMEGERRGRGEPRGPLVKFMQIAFRIICNETLTSHGVRWFLYKNYRKHLHFEYASAQLSGFSGFKA